MNLDPRFPIWVALLSAILILPLQVAAEESEGWMLGVAGGLPQTLALTIERDMEAGFRLQCHAGTVLVMSSAGIRALWIQSGPGAEPYAFAGGGVFNIAEGEGGGAFGGTRYGWGGFGANFTSRNWQAYAEVGIMAGLNRSNNYSAVMSSFALGVTRGGR